MILSFHIDPSDNPTLSFAGSELASHLERLSVSLGSLELPYHIRLQVDSSLSDGDSYFFHFLPQGGLICGSNPRSVLLGVYAYLRHIGFVFLRPDQGGTFVPTISKPQALFCPCTSHTPSFPHRGVCIEGADSLENILDFIHWLPKNGYNAFFVQFKSPDVFLERWYQHTYNPLLPSEETTPYQLAHMEQKITSAMELRGITDHRVGHGWTGECLGFANTGWHQEDTSLDESIKPLIAEVNGKRELWGGIPTNTNLCYANPTARRRLVEQVVDYAKHHPSVNYLHFWLADEHNNLCECSLCRETTLSDQYTELLNEIDAALTTQGLPTKIVFLLYQELLYAPLHAGILHPERFCMMFAPISRTFTKSYPKRITSTAVPPYIRNRMELPKTLEGNLAHYFRWKQHFSGECFFYDYPLGRAHYGDFGYMKIARVIYDDIHTLEKLRSNGYMSCQELRAMTPTGFPNYVMGQALLDVRTPFEVLKQTYFSALLGEDYPTAVLYLEQLSALSDMDYVNGHGERLQPDKEAQFRQIAKVAADFLEENRIPQSHKENWEFLRFHARYCILLANALAELCIGNTESANALYADFCQWIRENELRYQSQMDVYRIIEVTTKYTGFTLPIIDHQEISHV